MISNQELIKSLEEAGHRESALLFKNWGEMDAVAKSMCEKLEKKDLGYSYSYGEPDGNHNTGTSNHYVDVHHNGEHVTTMHVSGDGETGSGGMPKIHEQRRQHIESGVKKFIKKNPRPSQFDA